MTAWELGEMLSKFGIGWAVFFLPENSVPSLRTETKLNLPKPKFLGSAFEKEPIGTLFSWNWICSLTKEPNQSILVNRTPRVNCCHATSVQKIMWIEGSYDD
jgi:hypothetical protein